MIDALRRITQNHVDQTTKMVVDISSSDACPGAIMQEDGWQAGSGGNLKFQVSGGRPATPQPQT